MKKYLVEGWVQGTVTVYEEIEAESKQEAIDIIRAHYEENVYMDINNEELSAQEVN